MKATDKLMLPVDREELCKLEAGQWVGLTGKMLVARDQAHIRLIKAIEEGKDLPVDLSNQALLYAGPVVGKNRTVIGPTTSSRMDLLTEPLLSKGLALTVGKGMRGNLIKEFAVKYKTAYLMTFGGAAAFLSQFVIKAKMVAYGDLGPEALFVIEVDNFPAIVAIDCNGNVFKG